MNDQHELKITDIMYSTDITYIHDIDYLFDNSINQMDSLTVNQAEELGSSLFTYMMKPKNPDFIPVYKSDNEKKDEEITHRPVSSTKKLSDWPFEIYKHQRLDYWGDSYDNYWETYIILEDLSKKYIFDAYRDRLNIRILEYMNTEEYVKHQKRYSESYEICTKNGIFINYHVESIEKIVNELLGELYKLIQTEKGLDETLTQYILELGYKEKDLDKLVSDFLYLECEIHYLKNEISNLISSGYNDLLFSDQNRKEKFAKYNEELVYKYGLKYREKSQTIVNTESPIITQLITIVGKTEFYNDDERNFVISRLKKACPCKVEKFLNGNFINKYKPLYYGLKRDVFSFKKEDNEKISDIRERLNFLRKKSGKFIDLDTKINNDKAILENAEIKLRSTTDQLDILGRKQNTLVSNISDHINNTFDEEYLYDQETRINIFNQYQKRREGKYTGYFYVRSF